MKGYEHALITKVQSIIKDNALLSSGDTVLVGLSGGPDSVCLLHILCKIRNKLNIKIHAAHVNHMIRGVESDEDEAFVGKLCDKFDVVLHSIKIDIPAIAEKNKISVETAGRNQRYAYFDEIASKIGAERIAVAHNMNDQAETMLMRIARGTGTEGLAGMSYMRGRIIRPLLSVKREEIEKYCLDNMIITRTDETNIMNDFTRNAIRNCIIPEIDRICGSDFVKSAHRLSLILNDENNYLNLAAEKAYINSKVSEIKYDQGMKTVLLSITKLQMLDVAIARRVIRIAICKARGSLVDIATEHINAAFELSKPGVRNGKIAEFNSGIRAVRRYENLSFEDSAYIVRLAEEKRKWKLQRVRVFRVGEHYPDKPEYYPDKPEYYPDKPEYYPDKPDNTETTHTNWIFGHFDMDKLVLSGVGDYTGTGDDAVLPDGLVLRTREKEDKIRPVRFKGTKSLKKHFIDRKIPAEIRNSIPLLAVGKNILWIVGYEKSDIAIVTDNTVNILEIIISYEGNDF